NIAVAHTTDACVACFGDVKDALRIKSNPRGGCEVGVQRIETFAELPGCATAGDTHQRSLRDPNHDPCSAVRDIQLPRRVHRESLHVDKTKAVRSHIVRKRRPGYVTTRRSGLATVGR